MGAWVYGMNISGYLSESDTHACAFWANAASGFTDFVEEWADASDESHTETECGHTAENDEGHTEECFGTDRAFVDSILTDDPLVPNKNYEFNVVGNDERPYSFWLTWAADSTPEDTEDFPPTTVTVTLEFTMTGEQLGSWAASAGQASAESAAEDFRDYIRDNVALGAADDHTGQSRWTGTDSMVTD